MGRVEESEGLCGQVEGERGPEGRGEGEPQELFIVWRQEGVTEGFGASEWRDQLCVLDRPLCQQ